MTELANCTRCGKLFAKNIRDICQDCYKDEENAFNVVYAFLRQRKNREATLDEIVMATGVDGEIIIKFVKEKRLRTSQFPKLGYPCERCGRKITTGKICSDCIHELSIDLERSESEKSRVNQIKEQEAANKGIYHIAKQENN